MLFLYRPPHQEQQNLLKLPKTPNIEMGNSFYESRHYRYLLFSQMKLGKRGIDFVMFVLPYEFQVRMNDQIYNTPQNLLSAFSAKNDIQMVNIFDEFIQDEGESEKYY